MSLVGRGEGAEGGSCRRLRVFARRGGIFARLGIAGFGCPGSVVVSCWWFRSSSELRNSPAGCRTWSGVAGHCC
jgi:hypothetical protein